MILSSHYCWRARYGVFFLSSKSDLYFASLIAAFIVCKISSHWTLLIYWDSTIAVGCHSLKIHVKVVEMNQCWFTHQGWGLLQLRSLISPQAEYLILEKHLLDYLHHIHIWQVSPQLSCGNTWINFPTSRIFDLGKAPVRLFASHSYLTGVTAVELRQHLSNMNMIYNS